MAIKLKKQRPEPKFTTVEELRDYMFSISLYSTDTKRILDRTDYPCFRCGGKGKIRKAEDRDPVEGYKLAPWHECGKCEGKGKAHSAEYEPIVESELATTEEATKVYEKFLEKFNSVMEKIEPEDVEFLLENVKIVPNPK